MKTLRPLPLKDAYYQRIENIIQQIFDELIYKPVCRVIDMRFKAITSELKNSRDVLQDAIARGDIWYEDGQFKGSFNSKTSAAIIKLGGKYNVRAKTYSLDKPRVPNHLKFAQSRANERYETMRARLLETLDSIEVDNFDVQRLKDQYSATMGDIEDDLQETLPTPSFARSDNPAVEAIAIEATLTAQQKQFIAEEWGENLDLYIRGWAKDEIIKLRQQVEPYVLAGGRAEGLIKHVKDSYGVSTRKAKFLARQETSLAMATYKQSRYAQLGITKYRWSDSHDIRVRHDHHELNGKTFSYDQPPVTNKKTGARNNPGKDFGCRCIDIPVLDD